MSLGQNVMDKISHGQNVTRTKCYGQNATGQNATRPPAPFWSWGFGGTKSPPQRGSGAAENAQKLLVQHAFNG